MYLQELELGLRVALPIGAVRPNVIIAKSYRCIIPIDFIEQRFSAIISVDQK